MNKLHVSNDSGMLLIDKEDRQDPTMVDNYHHQSNILIGSFCDVISLYKLRNLDLKGMKLANDFNFKFMNWDTNSDVNKNH